MRVLAFLLISIICFTSCKSSKATVKNNKVATFKNTPSKADKIIATAQSYQGTKYKYGGTTHKGMDCSGLIYVAFKNGDIALPRVSRDMANQGTSINLKDVQKGDLLFFKTKAKGGKINHVGLVVNTSKNDIEFIHATTSKGVMTSLLSEPYWKRAFRKAQRIL